MVAERGCSPRTSAARHAMASPLASMMAEALSIEEKMVVIMGAFAETQATLNKLLEVQQSQVPLQPPPGMHTDTGPTFEDLVETTPTFTKHYTPMSQRKGVERIPVFAGVHEEFEQWRLKVRGLLSTDLDVKRMIKWAQKQKWEDLNYEDAPRGP